MTKTFHKSENGPCQQPMEKLNAMGADQIASWKDRVIILPVSIDGDKAKLKAHIQNRSWTKLEHFWSVSNDEVDFNAAAARAFVVSGVPEAILIGPDGRILWRGHPMEQFSGKSLKSRIDNALQ